MLILIRREGEQVFIDKGRFIVKVIGERDGAVYLGIKAPSDIEIDREEVFYRKIQDKKKESQNNNS